MSGTDQETLLEVRKWSGDLSGSSEVVEAPPKGLQLVGRPSRRSRTGWETLPEVRE